MLTHAQATWARELIAEGGHTIERIHSLTGASRQVISELREAHRSGDPGFHSCATWHCPTCGDTLTTTPCVWCYGESQRVHEAKRLAAFVARIVGRRIIQPRHPGFTSRG